MSAASKTLSALLQQATIDDHDDVLKACNASLKASKNDAEALRTKAIALLKLERWEDALEAIDGGGSQLQEKTRVEKAYALYKTGRHEEAKELARSATDSRGARHVEAQASYRSEDFANSLDVYKTLYDESHPEASDIRINKSAVSAQLEWTKQGGLLERKKRSREDTEGFEAAYNTACGSIARGELPQGSILLKTAYDLCKSNEDLPEDEKNAELLSIRAQQLYVLCALGKEKEAKDLASELSVQDISDASTRRIAQNNVIAAKPQGSNPYLNRRLLDAGAVLPTTDKLFSYQNEPLQQNNLTLELEASKPQSVIKATDAVLRESQPTTSAHVNALSALNAAAHTQGELANFGLKKILPLFEKRPADVGLAMTIIQLYVLTNNHGSAITVMEKLLTHLSKSSNPSHQDVVYAPGLVALQVSLYSSQNRKSQIKTALAKAAPYWLRHKSKPPTTLLEAAGTTLVSSTDLDHQSLAREIFTTLRKADPTSRLAAAGFIASHASHSPSSITDADLSLLPPVEEQIAGIDIEALEEAGIPPLPNSDQTSTRKRPLEEAPKPKKKRNRKSRLPKDYDPSKKPDPERWLPLKERSSYRPNRKKGKRKEGERERTQGGVVSEKAVEKGSEVVKGSGERTGGGGGGGKGKGKKKGKKG